MTCSNTSFAEYGKKIRRRIVKRALRANDIQARRLANELLNGGRKQRPGKAQRLLKEVKLVYKNVREAAGIVNISPPRKHCKTPGQGKRPSA